jgi:phospholipid/cholesterol/gamma-HCH transport system permease protein
MTKTSHASATGRNQPGAPGTFHILQGQGETVVRPQGDWTLAHYEILAAQIAARPPSAPYRLDLTQLTQLDTAGATLLVELWPTQPAEDPLAGLPAKHRALVAMVAKTHDATAKAGQARAHWLRDGLVSIGRTMVELGRNGIALLNFTGLTLCAILRDVRHPRRWRLTSLTAHVQQTGLNAMPIVALLTFLVGAVIAFLGATVLNTFGLSIYTVNLVVFAFLREFGVLLVAILLAGRTASAFTAQIGSMKVNEELDALRTQGLDPVQMLVVPRMFALLISLPLLTFLAMLAGICGGAVVAVFSLDISLLRFIHITQDVPIRHFMLGLGKAPIFAVVIALIGCLEGFKVEGSARSVGEHTTSSVVQSIFTVILLDAIAALFFMEMGW